jgi:hypothetical protein
MMILGDMWFGKKGSKIWLKRFATWWWQPEKRKHKK